VHRFAARDLGKYGARRVDSVPTNSRGVLWIFIDFTVQVQLAGSSQVARTRITAKRLKQVDNSPPQNHDAGKSSDAAWRFQYRLAL
jgi:hypothetical protein